jgi:ABC-type nitrate/sulfonate/bicarbonate transport system ATPase subunit
VIGAVSVVGLTHAYGSTPVLDAVSFTAAPGGLTALIGPTGCGKSTILRVLAGLVTPHAGTATVDGMSTFAHPGRCAYMPQGDTLLPWRRALDNAVLAADVARCDQAAARARAAALFVRFGLTGFEHAWPSQLSGGMRQRVALLRTVLADHPVLLLDEPFGALDAITRADLQGWLGTLLHAEARTTLLVTHDVDEALRLADRVVVLSSRPARVEASFALDGPRPRSAAAITTAHFAMVKRQILAALDGGSPGSV